MKRVFLIFSTDNIGGAEKRFAGLWASVNEANVDVQIILVGSRQLLSALQKQEAFNLQFEKQERPFIEYDLSGGFKKFRQSARAFVAQYTSKNDILHFVGDHPLCHFPFRHTIYSITQSSLKNLNVSGKLGQFGGVAFSHLVDVLDPTIYHTVRRAFFYKKNKIVRTSNSYCDVSLFRPLPYPEKKNWFVFLGRFEAMKQVKELLYVVPSLYQSLTARGIEDLHFFLFGHGSLEAEIRQLVNTEAYKNLPLTIEYTDKPNEVLEQSKFFFSLQLNNNYPSRSLIEAMAAGNIPIVTDVGQTRWLARPEFSYYVPEHFEENDMLKTVCGIYNEQAATLAEKSRLARAFVMKEHTIEKMREYYIALYQKG